MNLLVRFVLGGMFVSLFALAGDIFRPKSFAGLFGAAPSIAIATLCLALIQNGKAYAAIESRSVILGALAFFIYASLVSWSLMRFRKPALGTTVTLLPVWFFSAFGLYFLLLAGR